MAWMPERLKRGDLVWVQLDPTRGREQAGTRPVVIIAHDSYLASVPELIIVVPVTTTDRGWPHHVGLSGEDNLLPQASFAMTEQPQTISRARITGRAGLVDDATMADIRRWLLDFVG